MTSALACLAWSSMFLAMDLLSYRVQGRVSSSHGAWSGKTVYIAYIWDDRQDGRVKEPVGRRILPLLVVGGELDGCQMPLDSGHGHRAVSPWRAKVKIERVVFDIRIARVGLSKALAMRCLFAQAEREGER